MPAPQNDKHAPPSPPPAPRARWRWIVSNEQGARVIQLRGSVSSVSRTLVPGPSFVLSPGANVVDALLWERWKREHSTVEVDGVPERGEAERLLTDPIPEADHAARRQEGAGSPHLVEGPLVADRTAPLAALSEPEARAVVAHIREEAMLRRLLQTERRSTVAEALRGQIERHEKAARAAAV